MGETSAHVGLSDAAGRRAAGRLAARLALKLARDESGATAVEYGLILALIFLVIVGAVTNFANKTDAVLNTASSTINTAM